METKLHIKLSIAIYFLISVCVYPQTIPEQNIVDWTNAGLEYTIEEPGQIFSVIDYGAVGDGYNNDSDAVLSALEAMNGLPGILYFPAGDYLLSEPIYAHSGLVVRGAGASETSLLFMLASDDEHAIVIAAYQTEPFVNVLSSHPKGASFINTCNAQEFSIGDYLDLQQENDDWDVSPANWATKVVGQIVKVESINGNHLVIKNPLRINYKLNLHPELRRIEPIKDVKIENLKIKRLDNPDDGGGKNIFFCYAINCQVSGVESNQSQGSHIYATHSSNLFFFGNYIHEAFLYDGVDTRGYGITLNQHTGECLIENNIFRDLRHAMVIKTGANGNVFAFNYSREPHRSEPLNNFSGDISAHGHYAYSNLFEENIVQNIIIDHYWGPSGPYNTFARNRAELYGFMMTTNEILETQTQNIVGNEISAAFPYGFYTITGAGHTEYGNNDGGIVVPAGTSDYDDLSYYYTERPWFLDSNLPFPTIGYPNSLNQNTIPAKVRFVTGAQLTQEIEMTVGVNNALSEFNNDVQIIENPVYNVLKLHTNNGSSYKYIIYDLVGDIKKTGVLKKHESTILIDVSQLSRGVYLMQISNTNTKKILKLYKH